MHRTNLAGSIYGTRVTGTYVVIRRTRLDSLFWKQYKGTSEDWTCRIAGGLRSIEEEVMESERRYVTEEGRPCTLARNKSHQRRDVQHKVSLQRFRWLEAIEEAAKILPFVHEVRCGWGRIK